jgi:hypothetical protein
VYGNNGCTKDRHCYVIRISPLFFFIIYIDSFRCEKAIQSVCLFSFVTQGVYVLKLSVCYVRYNSVVFASPFTRSSFVQYTLLKSDKCKRFLSG